MTEPLRFGDLYKESADALKPLPDGEYPASVQDAQSVMSQNGKPMLKIKLLVSTPGGQKKVIPTQLVVSMENPTALAIFFKHMEAFGLGSSFWTNTATLEQAATALVGKTVRVILETSEWQGQARNNVKNYLAPLGGLQTGPAAAPTVLGVGTPVAAPSGPSASPAAAPVSGPTVGASPTIGNGPVAF